MPRKPKPAADAAENPKAVAGDNSMGAAGLNADDDVSAIGGELKQFIERIERLEEEKTGIAGDIKEVYAELSGRGFNAKIVRAVLKRRKQDAAERDEEEALLDTYERAIAAAANDLGI